MIFLLWNFSVKMYSLPITFLTLMEEVRQSIIIAPSIVKRTKQERSYLLLFAFIPPPSNPCLKCFLSVQVVFNR